MIVEVDQMERRTDWIRTALARSLHYPAGTEPDCELTSNVSCALVLSQLQEVALPPPVARFYIS